MQSLLTTSLRNAVHSSQGEYSTELLSSLESFTSYRPMKVNTALDASMKMRQMESLKNIFYVST